MWDAKRIRAAEESIREETKLDDELRAIYANPLKNHVPLREAGEWLELRRRRARRRLLSRFRLGRQLRQDRSWFHHQPAGSDKREPIASNMFCGRFLLIWSRDKIVCWPRDGKRRVFCNATIRRHDLQDMKRTDLVDRVARFRMVPRDAEAEAARGGLERIAAAPDPSVCDPLSMSRWTLAMVLAWIRWRDIDMVRRQCEAYRSECRVWAVGQVPGHKDKKRFLKDRFPYRHGSFEEIARTTGVREHLGLGESVRQMRQALETAKITANAVLNGMPTTIPAQQIPYLHVTGPETTYDQEYLLGTEACADLAYRQVELDRDAVLSAWPALGAGIAELKVISGDDSSHSDSPSSAGAVQRGGLRRRGREKGDGPYVANDRLIVAEIERGVLAGIYKGPWDGALALDRKIQGSKANRTKRIVERYAEWVGDKP